MKPNLLHRSDRKQMNSSEIPGTVLPSLVFRTRKWGTSGQNLFPELQMRRTESKVLFSRGSGPPRVGGGILAIKGNPLLNVRKTKLFQWREAYQFLGSPIRLPRCSELVSHISFRLFWQPEAGKIFDVVPSQNVGFFFFFKNTKIQVICLALNTARDLRHDEIFLPSTCTDGIKTSPQGPLFNGQTPRNQFSHSL